MNTDSLAHKTLKNVSYNLIGYFLPFIFFIFITPIIVSRLGAEKYGVYILVKTVTSLLGLFDLGIGNTLVKYVAEYRARGEYQKIKNLIYSLNIVLLGLAISGLVFLMSIGFLANFFSPSQVISKEYYFILFLLSGLIFFVDTISATYTIVPVALQRFDMSIKIGLINLVLSNLAILFLVLFGYGLKAIFLSQLFFAILLFFEYRFYSQKLLPEAKLKYILAKEEIINTYKFGVTTYMSNMANSALTYFDRLLIPIYLGPIALSYYSLPGSIAAKNPGLLNNISAVIFPMISSLNGIENIEKIKSIYNRVFNLITVLAFAVTISIIVFANKILFYWLSPEFAEKSTGVLIILAITYYLLSLAGILNSFLFGLNKTKFLFKSSAVMAITNVALLFILLPKFGVIGAAWAYLISVLPIIFMFFYTEKKFLFLSNRTSFYSKLYLKLFVTAIVFVLISKYAILPLVNSLRAVIIFGPISVLLYLLIYKIFRFYEKEDLELIKKFLLSIFIKIWPSSDVI